MDHASAEWVMFQQLTQVEIQQVVVKHPLKYVQEPQHLVEQDQINAGYNLEVLYHLNVHSLMILELVGKINAYVIQVTNISLVIFLHLLQLLLHLMVLVFNNYARQLMELAIAGMLQT